VRCRTAACGGQLFRCDHCGEGTTVIIPRRNRHCPTCHREQTSVGWEQQRGPTPALGLLSVDIHPAEELRALCFGHQKALYGLVGSTAPRRRYRSWLGSAMRRRTGDAGRPAHLTRALLYLPRHLLVSAGGLLGDGQQWVAARNPAVLVPGLPWAKSFGKFRSGSRTGLAHQVSRRSGKELGRPLPAAGQGLKVLDYLGRYVFRVAITQPDRGFDQGRVTFRSDNRSQQLQRVNLSAEESLADSSYRLAAAASSRSAPTACSVHSDAKLRQARALLEAASPQPAPAHRPVPRTTPSVCPARPALVSRCQSAT